MSAIYDKLDTRAGSLVVSALLGLGLAALFRKVCKDKSCIVIRGPSPQETQRYYYKYESDCYKYTPEPTDCETTVK